jgi:hypothetical protein
VSLVAKVYAGLVAVLALYAWCVEIAFLHSAGEHLLPGLLLSIASMPLSLSLSSVYARWPTFFQLPFTQLGWLTLCGVVQALILFGLARTFAKAVR